MKIFLNIKTWLMNDEKKYNYYGRKSGISPE